MKRWLLLVVVVLACTACQRSPQMKTINISEAFTIDYAGMDGYGTAVIHKDDEILKEKLQDVAEEVVVDSLIESIELVPRQKAYLKNLTKQDYFLEYNRDLAEDLHLTLTLDRSGDQKMSKIVVNLPEAVFSYKQVAWPSVVDKNDRAATSRVESLEFTAQDKTVEDALNAAMEKMMAQTKAEYEAIKDGYNSSDYFNTLTARFEITGLDKVVLFKLVKETGSTYQGDSWRKQERILAVATDSGRILNQDELMTYMGYNAHKIESVVFDFIQRQPFTNQKYPDLGQLNSVDELRNYVWSLNQEVKDHDVILITDFGPDSPEINYYFDQDQNLCLLSGMYRIVQEGYSPLDYVFNPIKY